MNSKKKSSKSGTLATIGVLTLVGITTFAFVNSNMNTAGATDTPATTSAANDTVVIGTPDPATDNQGEPTSAPASTLDDDAAAPTTSTRDCVVDLAYVKRLRANAETMKAKGGVQAVLLMKATEGCRSTVAEEMKSEQEAMKAKEEQIAASEKEDREALLALARTIVELQKSSSSKEERKQLAQQKAELAQLSKLAAAASWKSEEPAADQVASANEAP